MEHAAVRQAYGWFKRERRPSDYPRSVNAVSYQRSDTSDIDAPTQRFLMFTVLDTHTYAFPRESFQLVLNKLNESRVRFSIIKRARPGWATADAARYAINSAMTPSKAQRNV
ncbi:hypothetical protein EVAR_42520_1 [Eumeta japonica]|uniref:Uncharacterized protein n=1 Tax=Eumeta variegata TaxID=151549 RepID=A0A4C1XGS5_EUMVA|nr:hypothetical protein EVAR_42520_1 [Eumeta japonica]